MIVRRQPSARQWRPPDARSRSRPVPPPHTRRACPRPARRPAGNRARASVIRHVRTCRSRRCDTSRATVSRIRGRRARPPAGLERRRRRVRGNAASLPACRSCRAPRRRSGGQDGEWSEHRRTRADNQIHRSLPDPVPLIVTFTVGETAMLDRHTIAEHRADLPDHLWRQAISGTSINTRRPASIACAASRRYSSVFPLPVTPCSSAVWNSPSSSRTLRSTSAASCSGVNVRAGSAAGGVVSAANGSRSRRSSVRRSNPRAPRRRSAARSTPRERSVDGSQAAGRTGERLNRCLLLRASQHGRN